MARWLRPEHGDILTAMQDGRGQDGLQPDSSPADAPTEPDLSAAMRTADVANGEHP